MTLVARLQNHKEAVVDMRDQQIEDLKNEILGLRMRLAGTEGELRGIKQADEDACERAREEKRREYAKLGLYWDHHQKIWMDLQS